MKRCDEIFDTLRNQYVDTKVPENISLNAGVKSNLNVQGPNPYFILARFLVQVENIETLEYKIEKLFTVIITKKLEEGSFKEEEEEVSYKI